MLNPNPEVLNFPNHFLSTRTWEFGVQVLAAIPSDEKLCWELIHPLVQSYGQHSSERFDKTICKGTREDCCCKVLHWGVVCSLHEVGAILYFVSCWPRSWKPLIMKVMSLWWYPEVHIKWETLNFDKNDQLFLGYRPMGLCKNSPCLEINNRWK